jgi:hypothetical protein
MMFTRIKGSFKLNKSAKNYEIITIQVQSSTGAYSPLSF